MDATNYTVLIQGNHMTDGIVVLCMCCPYALAVGAAKKVETAYTLAVYKPCLEV